jgi:hypothetical protein
MGNSIVQVTQFHPVLFLKKEKWGNIDEKILKRHINLGG